MASAGDAVVKGSCVIGYNGRTYGTLLQVDSSEEPIGDIKEIRGAQNAVVAKIITNPGKKYKVSGVLLSADLTAIASMKKGDTVSINSVSAMVESASLEFSGTEAKATIEAVKEDSMTYT